MKIRHALLGEIPTVARVATLAFAKDPSYGHFYPWRDHYPEDFYLHLLGKYRQFMVTPGCVIIVAELEQGDLAENQEEKEIGMIVGFAIWQISGVTEQQQAEWNGDSQLSAVYRNILEISHKLDPTDRAVGQEGLDHFWSQAFAIQELTDFSGKLDFLTFGVLPEFQKRGIGKQLVVWGFERGRGKLPVFLDASSKSCSLLLRLGCKIIGQIVQESKTYKKKWGGKDLPEVYVERLETPVMRWDPGNGR